MIEPAFAAAAASFVAPAATHVAEGELDQSLRRIASGWQSPPAPPRVEWTPPADPTRERDAIEFSWAGETARHIGTVVHRWLQRIANDGL